MVITVPSLIATGSGSFLNSDQPCGLAVETSSSSREYGQVSQLASVALFVLR